MKKNKTYLIKFPSGDSTTVILREHSVKSMKGEHVEFEYPEGETRMPITPDRETRMFSYPKSLLFVIKYEEII